MNSRPTSAAAERSRMRLVVLQALVLALFSTLLVRLWYLQVASGDDYRAKAASQSVREVVVQPDRGLIVDAQGRPLVANRSSWVVSIDRTTLGQLSTDEQDLLLERVAKALHHKVKDVRARLLNCGTEGSVAGTCWNGSPFQPVPVDDDVDQQTAQLIREQAEDYPGVVVQEQSVRAYPRPYGVEAAHVLGYLSPVTEDELTAAEKKSDLSVNGASQVGRAGVEKEYDAYLRGMPGYQHVAVDSKGRVLGESGRDDAVPGDTLVTSIDAKVQGVAESELHKAILAARARTDRNGVHYRADSGAVVVLDAHTGRVIAMASEPTYDPGIWVGGITQKQLSHLYSEKAGTPLLARAMQGQFAPGSTWKPIMTVGAMLNGMGPDTRLNCSPSVQIGNRAFGNYESESFGMIDFKTAITVSCNTFFYRVGLHFWQKYGSDPANENARDPLVAEAKKFGFGKATGIDIPGEASGRIADRHWKRAYYDSMKKYYCGLAKHPGDASAFVKLFAKEFCAEGYLYRAGDAANFAIGQGDTIVTPLQLARAYAALANGGTLYRPTVGKAIVDADGKLVKRIEPVAQAKVRIPRSVLAYVRDAMNNVTLAGTLAGTFAGWPQDKVTMHGKTGTAEVYGKQTTGWVGSYTKDYVVVSMISQAGTGAGANSVVVRKIWDTLYGFGEDAKSSRPAIPGVTETDALPVFSPDGAILPPARKENE
ncbi:penicillin-binding protein 2 [Nocardioides jiangxiensis]|uniref:Penicillin-binding protein 2 n=1 Tax=Nocardioides jiangxiensis TaxID=3064524 RepID=A0ABT9B304_9ACTN|nr:penicillin-binding protein 2 [Nocardioides sp. WY-20]MDO7869078.1 penicillin-binding protein 2 [Nocardioides sp. WY-20]